MRAVFFARKKHCRYNAGVTFFSEKEGSGLKVLYYDGRLFFFILIRQYIRHLCGVRIQIRFFFVGVRTGGYYGIK